MVCGSGGGAMFVGSLSSQSSCQSAMPACFSAEMYEALSAWAAGKACRVRKRSLLCVCVCARWRQRRVCEMHEQRGYRGHRERERRRRRTQREKEKTQREREGLE